MVNQTINKHFLLRKISIIHAIKCDKAKSFQTDIDSFKRLDELKKLVVESNDSQLTQVNIYVNSWKDTEPIVTDSEMEQLLKSK